MWRKNTYVTSQHRFKVFLHISITGNVNCETLALIFLLFLLHKFKLSRYYFLLREFTKPLLHFERKQRRTFIKTRFFLFEDFDKLTTRSPVLQQVVQRFQLLYNNLKWFFDDLMAFILDQDHLKGRLFERALYLFEA